MRQFFFAQKAFILHDGHLLLVQKSADDPHNPGKWEVPGGRMDFGEDVDDHIRREVREEVGLEVVPGSPFHVWQWQLRRVGPDGEPIEIQIVGLARLCTAESTEVRTDLRVEDDYLGEARWVSLAEIPSYDLIPNMIPVIRALFQLGIASSAAPPIASS